jgi:hypothetical protein
VHETIGGAGHISASTSATGSSSSTSSSSKDHRVDDTPIEHTSFGGSAQNNNTVKSRAEQMATHRRVRINPPLSFFLFGLSTFGFCSAALFAARFMFFFKF